MPVLVDCFWQHSDCSLSWLACSAHCTQWFVLQRGLRVWKEELGIWVGGRWLYLGWFGNLFLSLFFTSVFFLHSLYAFCQLSYCLLFSKKHISAPRIGLGFAMAKFHLVFQSWGAAILISKNVLFLASKVDADSLHHCHWSDVWHSSCYASNWDDARFYTNFLSRLPDINTHHLILGWDFNYAISATLDRSSLKPARSPLQMLCSD